MLSGIIVTTVREIRGQLAASAAPPLAPYVFRINAGNAFSLSPFSVTRQHLSLETRTAPYRALQKHRTKLQPHTNHKRCVAWLADAVRSAHDLYKIQVASGFIRSRSKNEFTSGFVIDGALFQFEGVFEPAVKGFSCCNARLRYADVGQLDANQVWAGTIGRESITMSIKNGATVSGLLDMPVFPSKMVNGSGAWSN